MHPILTATGGLIRESLSEFRKDGAQQLGAALAYYTTISIAPIVVVAVGLAGWFFGRDAASAQFIEQLNQLLGPIGAQVAESVLTNTAEAVHGFAAIVGLVAVVLGSTTVFAQLQSALNTIWSAEAPKRSGLVTLLRVRAISFAIVLGIGFLLMVSLVFSAILSAASETFDTAVSVPDFAMQSIETTISLGVTTLLFGVLFKLLPDVKIAWTDVWLGAAVTSVLFNLGKVLIGVYLGNSSVGSAYGAAGSLVVLLVWVYYSAQIVLFGAEFTEVFSRRFGSRRGVVKRHPVPVEPAEPAPDARQGATAQARHP